MATLTDDVKQFIVHALACYDTPSQVVHAVKEEFRLDISRQQASRYDPTKPAGSKLHQRWRDEFAKVRKDFINDASQVGIAHRAVRLRALARMATKAEEGRNIALAVQIIEQAAKEVGDVFVNRRLDQPKAPGADEHLPSPEYTLKPDEDVPAKPIL